MVDITKNNNGLTLAKYSRNRMLDKNKNSLLAIVGETGSGKSLASGELSGMIDETFFDDHERVVFQIADFFEQVDKMKHGEGLVYEEAGVTLAARDFQKKLVKMVGAVNQTFRHRNLSVIYNVPSMKFIEMQVRDLLHGIIDMKSIDFDNNVSYGDLWRVNHNALYGTTTLDKYEFTTWGGGRHVVDKVGFGLPPKKWIIEYEKMKTDFTTELYESFKLEAKGEAPTKKDTEMLRKQSQGLLNAIPELKKSHTWDEVAAICKCGDKRTLQNWLKAAGIVLKDAQNNKV